MSRFLSLMRAALHKTGDGLSWGLAFWQMELGELFPWVARLSGGRRPYVLLRLGQESSEARTVDPRAKTHSDEVEVDAEFPGVAKLDELAGRLKPLLDGRPLHVSMAPNAALVMVFDLPVVARRALRKAVSYRLLTESPITPSRLVFDVRLAKPLFESNRVQVDVAVAQKDEIEKVANALGTCGLRVDAIGFALPNTNRLDFVFWRSSTAEAGLAQSRLHRRLIASACLLALLAFPLTTLAAKWLEQQTRTLISALRSPDPKQLDAEARQQRAETQRKELLGQLPVVQVSHLINEVGRYLPADAWVNRLEYGYGKLALVGQAAAPFLALRELRKSVILADAKLDGVISPANPGEPPQVEISVELPSQSAASKDVAGHGLRDYP